MGIIGYTNVFALCLNSASVRFSEYMQKELSYYNRMFGENFFKQLVIVFTHYGNKFSDQEDRENGLAALKEDLILQFKTLINNIKLVGGADPEPFGKH